MKKVFHLATCSTCKRIIDDLGLKARFQLQDIKTEGITGEQLDIMAGMAGSYEALFSRRAIRFRTMGLAQKELDDRDYRRLILEEYTFLKRPVIVLDDEIFIGSSPSSINALRHRLG